MAWYNYNDAILLTEEEFREPCDRCTAFCAEGSISVPCSGDREECIFFGKLDSDAYDKKIRAKAITEFAEKLKANDELGCVRYLEIIVDEIATELKGE